VARRATYFFDADAVEPPKLLVSGGWEFINPNGTMPDKRILESLLQAYQMLNYDIGFIGSFEAENLSLLGLAVESARKTAAEAPFSVLTTKTGDAIGFIRFPSLPPGEDTPSADLIDTIAKQIRNIQSSVRLIVGLSDWGWVGEREYLAQNPIDVPDMLFGSGAGSGVNGRIEADGRCLWVRPYDKGKTISNVQIMKWPDRNGPFSWSIPDVVKPSTVGLGDQYQDNPDVDAILQ
jgi:hypothetical protein